MNRFGLFIPIPGSKGKHKDVAGFRHLALRTQKTETVAFIRGEASIVVEELGIAGRESSRWRRDVDGTVVECR
ncbi:hypothetical protein CCMA1212_004812 [Trichoderma ghanense]|uniref:Uncharacterized protein n=1 Tax=Trichoderma ghanense TaxID=65468 RepID=A0ABY2H695_9HYPO